jgi:hypothetical protein
MGAKGATAEVFLAAFKSMARKEQDIFLSNILKDKRVREDLIDIAIAESRAKDKSRPFRNFLEKQGYYSERIKQVDITL